MSSILRDSRRLNVVGDDYDIVGRRIDLAGVSVEMHCAAWLNAGDTAGALNELSKPRG
jgi:hypothetical protein